MAIIVHGGAGVFPEERVDEAIGGCERAAKRGHQLLLEGRSALDAVEEAVKDLEDNPLFNAGHGSVVNELGQVEMDAFIMDGGQLNYGAVACLKNVANPISVARLVMERTEHVMLVGEGANEFAKEMDVPEATQSELISWRAPKKGGRQEPSHRPVVKSDDESICHTDQPRDTVGAVAVAHSGNMACATSTGGIMMKRVGRVGDAPLIGCGGYCENGLGGVSCTGRGESIARAMLAHRALLLQQTHPPDEAIAQALAFMQRKTGGTGGLIMITQDGMLAKGHNSKMMAWAGIDRTSKMQSGM